MTEPHLHHYQAPEPAPRQEKVDPKVASAVIDVCREQRMNLAEALSESTTEQGVERIASKFSAAEHVAEVARLAILELERDGIIINPSGGKPKQAKSKWGNRRVQHFDENAAPAPYILPSKHISARYAPSDDILPEASSILRDVAHEIFGRLVIKDDNGTPYVFYHGMTPQIGMSISARLEQVEGLDPVQRGSLHTILVSAAEELLVSWCQDRGLSLRNDKKAPVIFDRLSANSTLCQLRQRRTFTEPLAPENLEQAKKVA